jgi:3'5'-cyclic nucleotide phosphodiesterase
MNDEFNDLRDIICPSKDEEQRLHQLVFNCVMATDIMDKDLNTLRNKEWEEAFLDNDECSRGSSLKQINVLLAFLVQSADLSHSMQHFDVYRKWNEHLIEEMYFAYLNGRADRDPCDFWYQGELAFFDVVVIPLAKKLQACSVLDVISNESLRNAIQNRSEWEKKGLEIATSMKEIFRSDHESN